MRKLQSIFFVCLIMFSFSVSAQTVDEIIASHISAIGGAQKINDLKSVKMTGSMSVQGTDIYITNSRVHNVGWRMDMDIMGTSNFQLINKKKGIVFMPVMGMQEPQDMEPDQYNSAIGQLDVQGALYNYKEKGNKVTLAGKEMTDGSEAYKLDVEFPNGFKAVYYIDAKTYRHIKSISKAKVRGEEAMVETSFGDFRDNGQGYWFPYMITTTQGTLTFDKIDTNVAIDESIFQ